MNELPETLFIGKINGEWPIRAFTKEEHVISWLMVPESEGGKRRVWKITLTDYQELKLVRPEPFLDDVS